MKNTLFLLALFITITSIDASELVVLRPRFFIQIFVTQNQLNVEVLEDKYYLRSQLQRFYQGQIFKKMYSWTQVAIFPCSWFKDKLIRQLDKAVILTDKQVFKIQLSSGDLREIHQCQSLLSIQPTYRNHVIVDESFVDLGKISYK